MAKVLKEKKESLVHRASLLHLSARTIAENMRSGNFKSLYRGQGIEFSDVREYLPGDNVRSIDWNVTARMGRAFIKQYEEDRELQVFFVLDRSLSMFTGSAGKTRLETASEAAALLVLAALQNDSSIGAVFFDGEIKFSLSPKAGREQAMIILSHLDETDSKIARGSVLSSAINGAGKILKKRSIVFVISDFRSTNWEQNLGRLAVKNDVIALRIEDPQDSAVPSFGTVSFIDPESGEMRDFPTSSSKFADKWLEEYRKRKDYWKDVCIKHGAYPLTLSTEEDPVLVLSRFFAGRTK